MNQKALDLSEGEIRNPVGTYSYRLRNKWSRTRNFSKNNANQNPKFFSLNIRTTQKSLNKKK